MLETIFSRIFGFDGPWQSLQSLLEVLVRRRIVDRKCCAMAEWPYSFQHMLDCDVLFMHTCFTLLATNRIQFLWLNAVSFDNPTSISRC